MLIHIVANEVMVLSDETERLWSEANKMCLQHFSSKVSLIILESLHTVFKLDAVAAEQTMDFSKSF